MMSSLRKEVRDSLETGHIIRFKPEHAVEGFAVLLNNGQVGALPDNTYVVGSQHLGLLKKAGVPYELVKSKKS